MIGSVLEGKYRIARLIGEGGMGVVYEAEHTLIGRPVAVKLLHGEYARDADVVQRFIREARAATAIRHANIIDVTDMGTTPGGQPFLVMELLDGVPLSKALEGGRTLLPERLAEIMGQVLDALDAVHRKGIVHRDLKPDNIFLIEHAGRRDFVKVLDFGVSKVVSAAGAAVSMTRTGSVLGTPQYMAPEQAMGRKDVDHRVDLWAVGVMMYEASTGRLPYEGDNYNELLTAILTKTPPRPREVRPDIDPALEALILRGMAKERDERWATAAEFRDAVRSLGRRESMVVESSGTASAGDPGAQRMSVPTSRWAPQAVTLTSGAHDTPATPPPRRARKKMLVGAAVGGVAMLGIVLTFALRGGPSSDHAGGARRDPVPAKVGPAAPPPGATAPFPAAASPIPVPQPAVRVPAAPGTTATPLTPAAAIPSVQPSSTGPAETRLAGSGLGSAAAGTGAPADAAVRTPTPSPTAGHDSGARPPSGRGGRDAATVPPPTPPVAVGSTGDAAASVTPIAPVTASVDAGGVPAGRDAGVRESRLRGDYEGPPFDATQGGPATPPRDADRNPLRPGYE